jgi:two-component system, cell cycle response regulator DivK
MSYTAAPVKTIMLVEDSADLRATYAAHLETLGFDVVHAQDGLEALMLAKAQPPDVVILDIALPKLDGFYVAELWKRDPVMARVPVIAVSAYTDGGYKERAIRSGCSLALEKPCTPGELAASIRAVLP